MGAIPDRTEAWHGHSGLEVETFIKSQLANAFSDIGGKVGFVERSGNNLLFYDEEGGTVISTISLAGDLYSITVDSDIPQSFYILADEKTKIITITPSTSVGTVGSSEMTPYPEAYTYIVSVNTGTGYVQKITGEIGLGGSASFDVRQFLTNGDNYIRLSVTGSSSNQTKTVVFTGTLTTLTMSCNHSWQTAWLHDSDYTITNIRFAGSLVKTLNVSVDDGEPMQVVYQANQSYTTTATTFTIPSIAFPAESNGVHSVKLWMTASGVSTRVIEYRIMCVVEDDTTPLVTINNIAQTAVNFTSNRLFSYAVYGANEIRLSMYASLSGIDYPVTRAPIVISEREDGVQYSFAYPLEIDTGIVEVLSGTLTASATPFLDEDEGVTNEVTMPLDNTYSYLATPGALFYMNAAARDNGSLDRALIINEMGSSSDGKFANSYTANWSGMTWFRDGWYTDDEQSKNRALCIPAGTSVTVNNFAPLGLSSYYDGMTIEFLIKNSYPSNYDTPILKMTSGNPESGLIIYPTKILILGTNERSDTLQCVNIMENEITHIAITFVKQYEGVPSRNLVSVYINGISNVNFSFSGNSAFGNGNLTIGQNDTDVYLYKMRVYGVALNSQAVFNNFLNCVIEGSMDYVRRQLFDDNNILDGSEIGYEQVKSAGFNTMVVTIPLQGGNEAPLPSYTNDTSYSGCSLSFEYADDPSKNVTVGNVALDGQGTTSKKYFRWNLRAKTGSNTTWTYSDGTTSTGKKGRMINDSAYPQVDRITAKKNYASSPQGHKMGMTGLYNDLYKQIGLGSHLPNENYRVAVYQFPFVGFKYNSINDSYEYIGLYTAGPDKGSKVTFGYSSSFESLLSLEGPDHDPRGTRFVIPYVNAAYSSDDESLTLDGGPCWDCDYVGNDLSSDEADDEAAIFALYESEWKPAYNVVFNNSPYIVSANELIAALDNPSIASVSDLCDAANAEAILAGTTNGYFNELLCFYDSSYELYFYSPSAGRFEKLFDVDSSCEHNVVTALRSGGYLDTNSPTTAQIVSARAARVKVEAPHYWDMDQTLFHYAYCILFGVTDNFAKNTYPFKFNPLLGSSDTDYASRWGWRQDDLDTVLSTDNNGQNTKSYSVEHGDKNDGTEIYQGGDSVLWVLIRDNYFAETKQMMGRIIDAAQDIASSLHVSGNYAYESLLNVVSYYCWEKSSKYFPATLYEHDRRWSYLEPWLLNPSQLYNNVPPLTQALGDQYQSERLWMERRIAYIMSKYTLESFSRDNAGYNMMALTLAAGSPFTFNISPAIDLYPVVARGTTDDIRGGRTSAGSSAAVTSSSSGATTNYIKGTDWIASLGDLCGLIMTTRGGGTEIPFSITSLRMQSLKIGDEDASKVKFNATSLQVSSPSITYIDGQNTATLSGELNLFDCPRLRTVLFSGSGLTSVLLPVGSKVTEVSFPSNCITLFLHSLPFLTTEHLTLPVLTGIRNLYINSVPGVDVLNLVSGIIQDPNGQLEYVTVYFGEENMLGSDVDALFAGLPELLGKMDYNDETGLSIVAGKPYVEGSIVATSEINTDTYDNLKNVTEIDSDTWEGESKVSDGTLKLQFDPNDVIISFKDDAVKAICVANFDTTGDGEINLHEASLASNPYESYRFRNNTSIVSFDEFKYFSNYRLYSQGYNQQFQNCTSLKSISLPDMKGNDIGEETFDGCTSLEEISFNSKIKTTNNVFRNCTSIKRVNFNSIDDLICSDMQIGSSRHPFSNVPTPKTAHYYINGEELVFPDVYVVPPCSETIGKGVFAYVKLLKAVILPEYISKADDYSFYDSSLTSITFQNEDISFGLQAFRYCSSLSEITLYGGCHSAASQVATAFEYCYNLKRINIASIDRYVTSNFGIASVRNAFGESSQEIHLYPINSNTEITEITIPNSITVINDLLFFYHVGLQSVIIPSSVTTIGSSAFHGCSSIRNISLPSGLQKINGSCFRDCTSLSSITIPNTVTEIGSSTFEGCSGLESITFVPTSTLTTLSGSSTFKNCSSLRSIVIPESVTGELNDTFNGCTSLESVTFAGTSHVTKIETNCFRSCSSLASIIIPSSVTNIGDNAFNGANSNIRILINGNSTSFGANWLRAIGSELTFSNRQNINATILSGTGNTGDSVFRTSGSLTKSNANSFYFGNWRKYFIGGDVIQPFAEQIFGSSNNREIHIGGDLRCTNESRAFLIFSANTKLIFVEVGGVIINEGAIINSNVSGCADGFMWHFAKTDGIACSATVASVSLSRVSKVYVGDGSSSENDQRVLDMYLADAEWSQYSSKLDLWYNYNGEFKYTE